MAPSTISSARLELPIAVFGPVEVSRLLRELQALEESILQAGIRTSKKSVILPKTSRLLETLAGNNNCNLLLDDDRKKLETFLKTIEAKAPVVHISFAVDPSALFMAKIVAWMRVNVHPYVLVHLGLQPTIAAGFIMRTANRTFDFSLRNRFSQQRQLLIDALVGATPGDDGLQLSPAPAASQKVKNE